MRYHIPAIQWSFFIGINDFECYADKFVIVGNFHAGVPESIVKSYETVEYLMAHAWYHYPMMDEAVAKLLRVLEMAIRLRCQQIQVEAGRKPLKALIDIICPESTAKELNETLHWLRCVRNYLMHPIPNTLLGSVGVSHIRRGVVVLNEIFLQDESSGTDGE